MRAPTLKTLALALPALALACGPKAPPPAPPVDPGPPPKPEHRTNQPAPLDKRDFNLPTAQEATLSNGLRVVLVENHEVPLVYVNLVNTQGGWTDPAGRKGLASATMDMLNEGAGKRDAAAISADLRQSGPVSNLRRPRRQRGVRPGHEEENRPGPRHHGRCGAASHLPEGRLGPDAQEAIADLEAAARDPSQMAARAWNCLMYGDTYAGRLSNASAYRRMRTSDMKKWWQIHRSAHSMILVGGDTTLEEIVPALESRFGGWNRAAGRPARQALRRCPAGLRGVDHLPRRQPEHRGQSVRGGLFVGDELDEDHAAFDLAISLWAAVPARINMNLREDKGWTYGARSSTAHNYLPASGPRGPASSRPTPRTPSSRSSPRSTVLGEARHGR